jgi:pimeloyl-ACP methyl ester carboxylesterase
VGLAYQRFGTGAPLVLLHGIGHRRQAWDAVLPLLASHREVIPVDLPGHGESPPLAGDGRSVAGILIEEIVGLLDELGLDRPNVAGCSLGGLLALEIAASGRAASVTALSPAGFWSSSSELRYAVAVNKAMQAVGRLVRPLGPVLSRSTAGRALIYALIVAKPSQVRPEQARGDMVSFLASTGAMNMILAAAVPFADGLPKDVQVTIGWGTRDRLLLPRQAQIATARLPQARLVPLPGCGHVPMTDNPQLVADVLLRGSQAEPRQPASELAPL